MSDKQVFPWSNHKEKLAYSGNLFVETERGLLYNKDRAYEVIKMGFTDGINHTGIQILDEKTQLLPLYFHSVGHYMRHGHALRPEGFGQHQIALCTQGGGIFSVDGKEFEIKKGDLFYFNPYISHEYYPTTPDWILIWVVFDGKDASDIVKYFDFGEYSVRHADDETLNKLAALGEKLYDTYLKEQKYIFSLTMDVLQMLSIASGCEVVKSKYYNEDGNIQKGSFSPVIEFIKQNYTKVLTLDDLVRKSKLSKNHFTRTFKKEYGVTPMVYLNRYRISVAKFLLTTTIRTSDEIAQMTGFNDTSYFCAVFRKFEGVSPMQYRTKHKR